jgi:cytochrome P450
MKLLNIFHLHNTNRLPYTEAVLMEVMRIATIAPAGVPHCAMKETQLQGFTIPKVSDY